MKSQEIIIMEKSATLLAERVLQLKLKHENLFTPVRPPSIEMIKKIPHSVIVSNCNTLVAHYENRICATLRKNLKFIYLYMSLGYYRLTARIGRLSLTCRKLKEVDCLNNQLCQKYQICCFGKWKPLCKKSR